MLDRRLEQSERIIGALEKGFEKMETIPGRKKNLAEGLIRDARDHVRQIKTGPALDAALIGAVQKTEHYCIAAWGTAKALAEAVGEPEIVRVMDRALKEGKKYDIALTSLAESEVTPALLSMAEESQEGADEAGRSSSSKRTRASGRRAARALPHKIPALGSASFGLRGSSAAAILIGLLAGGNNTYAPRPPRALIFIS
jgi:ferritin-like metal-binding protein YciE